MTEEKRFENKVKNYLSSIDAYYFKVWGGGFQQAGIPDVIACKNGIFIGIELKSSKGKPTELQKHNIKEINKSGGVGLILYPAGFEEFKKLMDEVMKCNSHIQGLEHLKNVSTSSNCIILKI